VQRARSSALPGASLEKFQDGDAVLQYITWGTGISIRGEALATASLCYSAAQAQGPIRGGVLMKSWKHRWHLITSFLFCAMAVIVGTLL